jgi:Co/Zn/Cd efflux system component
MDAAAGIVGAVVIASWALRLIKDAGAVLLDVNPDPGLAKKLRAIMESQGDELVDLHLWRLGPGHLGAILAIVSAHPREPEFYRRRLARFAQLAHVTVEVRAKDDGLRKAG